MWDLRATISAGADVFVWDEDLFFQLGAVLVPAKGQPAHLYSLPAIWQFLGGYDNSPDNFRSLGQSGKYLCRVKATSFLLYPAVIWYPISQTNLKCPLGSCAVTILFFKADSHKITRYNCD